jgi:hypothetical protein
VLYAGDPKSDRTADFRSFLARHFTLVGLADYLSLRQADTKGYDVIILDWPDLPPRERGVFKVPALSHDYDRPTILIGGGIERSQHADGPEIGTAQGHHARRRMDRSRLQPRPGRPDDL